MHLPVGGVPLYTLFFSMEILLITGCLARFFTVEFLFSKVYVFAAPYALAF